MSDKWKDRLSPILKVVSFLLGIGMVGLGLYGYITIGVKSAKDLFLNFYYIFFGAVLMLFELPFERVKKMFVFITNPFGKAIFLLFLAAITLDIWDAFHMIISIIAIADAVIHTIFLVCFYDPEKDSSSLKEPEVKKKGKGGPSGFGKKDLDEIDNDPAPKGDGILARRK